MNANEWRDEWLRASFPGIDFKIPANQNAYNSLIPLIEAIQRDAVDSAQERVKENGLLRLLVAKAGKSCHYCGLTNMGECKSGFPGCALADDLMCGEDEFIKHLRQERDSLRAKVQELERHLADARFAHSVDAEKLKKYEQAQSTQ